MNKQPEPQAIRDLAHSLWEQRGKPEGEAEQHWFEAERLLGAQPRTDNQRVDESVRESFPASDAPASGGPDRPPANAEKKWAAADAAKSRKSRAPSRTTSGEPEDNGPLTSGETPKLGSRDAPGG
jgi:Protein of unknown function (DUF2934)